jgi:hypothetical protein
VDERERLPIHRPDEQDLRATRLVERDRATEALRWLRLRAEVGTLEAHVRGLGQRASEREHLGERDAAPRRGTSSTRPPRLLAREFADSHQVHAPVARALKRRGDLALLEHLTQGFEGKIQLPLDEPMHVQPPRLRDDLRHRGVPPHVERLRGGHRTLGQGGSSSLGVERLLLMHHHIRALSVASHARKAYEVRSPISTEFGTAGAARLAAPFAGQRSSPSARTGGLLGTSRRSGTLGLGASEMREKQECKIRPLLSMQSAALAVALRGLNP